LGKGKRRLKSPDVLLSNVHGAMGPLLPALFESPVVGIALFDSQIRFRAINGALAAMNGLPVSTHIGKKLRYALGSSTGNFDIASPTPCGPEIQQDYPAFVIGQLNGSAFRVAEGEVRGDLPGISRG
jgi:PAS domain-containing protein